MAETKYQIKLQDLASAELKKIQQAMQSVENSTGDARKEFKQLEASTKYYNKLQAEIKATATESSLLASTWKKIDPTGITGAVVSADLLAGAITGATSAVIGFGKESVKEFLDGQVAITKLNALVGAAGDTFGFTGSQVNAMAEEMQASLGIDADLIRSAEGILVSFQNINGQAFPRALKASADMSQVFGSLESASTALGKALTNPADGLGALSRVGVQFTESEKAAINVMVDANDTLGAQALILDKVEKKFGGVAEAVGDTLQGKMNRLDLSVKDLKESFGALVAGPLADFSTTLTSIFNAMAGNEKLPQQMGLDQLKQQLKEIDAAMKVAGTSYTDLSNLMEYRQLAVNSILAREHSMNQQQPAGSPVYSSEFLKEEASKSAAKKVEAARKAAAERLKIETEAAQKEAAAQQSWADEVARAQADALKQRQQNEAAFADWQESQAAKELAEYRRQAKDEIAIDNAIEANRKSLRDKMLQEEQAAAEKLKQQQEAFVSLTIQSINQLASAWDQLAQQQLQRDLDVKEEKIRNIQDGVAEAEREYQAELDRRRAAGEDTTQFEVQGLETIKRAKLAAAAEEKKIKAEENALKRQAFEQTKNINIAMAIMNGAVAAVKMFTELGPLGFLGAGLVAGVTAAQVAVIAGQQAPALAEGGLVPATPGGRLVRVAEAGQAEAVIPLDRWEQFSGGGASSGDVYHISINGIQFDSAEELAVKISDEMSKLRRVGRIA